MTASSENLGMGLAWLESTVSPFRLMYFNTWFPVGGKGMGDCGYLSRGVGYGVRVEASICLPFPQDKKQQLWDTRFFHGNSATLQAWFPTLCPVTLKSWARINSSYYTLALSRCLATAMKKKTLCIIICILNKHIKVIYYIKYTTLPG